VKLRLSRAFVAFGTLVCALVCALYFAPIARAHEIGLSRGEYALEGSIVTAKLTFAWRDVTFAVPSLDANRDGTVTKAELAAARAALTAAFASRLVVRGDGVTCLPELADATMVEEDGLRITLRARCNQVSPSTASVDLGFFALLPLGHRHLAHLAQAASLTNGGAGSDALLSRTQHTLSLTSAPAGAASASSPAANAAPSRAGFFGMGLEHILTGFDHLLFLLGLVLVGGRAREQLFVVTAFTIGHSVSLAVATLGLWVPSARFVEPAIALSIVYVGVENVIAFSRDGAVHHRWRLTLPFGLVHGFGFASALREIGLPRAELPAALVLFNLGVEAGQLAALAVALPLLYAARQRGWLRERGLVVASLAIAVAGLVWFVRRVIGA
jgi:hydrogenase/urease accessory protein HupE